MKRALLLLLLSVSTLWGQFLPDIPDRLSYAGLFNGTSQYFSKTAPTKMDLNGSELITVTTTFETDSTGWTNDTFSDYRTTNARAHGGTKSLAFITTGVVLKPYGQLTTAISNTSTNKFTTEFWVYVPSTNTQDTVRIGFANQALGLIEHTTTKITKGAWKKMVINFAAPGTQTGLKVYPQLWGYTGASDTLYIDDVSLTQAYDGLIVVEYKSSGFTNHGSSRNAVMGRGDAVGGQAQAWAFTYTSANLLELFISDGTNSITHAPAINLNDNRYHKIVYVLNRTGNSDLYFDGVLRATASASSLGKMGAPTTDLFVIGSDAVAARSILGSIAETAFVRYTPLPSDIASWIAYANTQRFIPEPPGGGTTVLRLFGKENSAYDQSGTQGVLTNTGSTPIIPR